jgi:zinc protease
MNRKLNLALLLAGLCFTTAIAQPTLIEKIVPIEGKVVIPYERWKLPNGLTILLHEDHSDPVINVMVTYKVGSNRESIGKSGFAHFFEHMMFQGSKNVADEEHFRMVSNAGGDMNGFTQHDKTVYYETLPSNYLEMALWLEADRMGTLLDSLTSKKFENQRDAVKNEKSQNVENQPYGLAYAEEMPKALYPTGHPYSWPVIGYVDDLNRANLDDVKNFFMRWYGPNNAILSISGDFNPTETLKMIEKYFGTIKQGPEVKKLRVPAVTLASDKYAAYRDKTYMPLNMRVFPTVPQYHRDEPALDMLGAMMGSGNNSIFYKNFVKSKIAASASAYHSSEELSGELTISIFAFPPEDFNFEKLFTDLDTKIKATIDEFGNKGITADALARAKGNIEGVAYSRMSSVMGKNGTISEWERLLGKSYTVSDEIDRYNKVTLDDITRVFNKYVKGAGAAILNTYPIIDDKDSVKSNNPFSGAKLPENPEYAGLKYAPVADNFDRAKRPTAGETKTAHTPEYFTKTLANGLKIIGTRTAETPEVDISFSIEGGDALLGPDKIKKLGIASLTGELLNEGTKNFTTEQISAELSKLGSNIWFYQGGISVQCLKKNLDATLKLLEEKLLNPGWREDDFKLAKKQSKENIKNMDYSPELVAGKMFRYAVYGDNVYGLSPSAKTIDEIELADVKEYYEKFYSPNVTNVTIVGDIEEADVLAKLDFLNKWQNKNVVLPEPPQPLPVTEPKFFVYHKKLAPSSVIMMGYPSEKFDPYGDQFKSRIANFAFGGNFNSRLNLNLRENKGYTYGIRSSFYGGKKSGVFEISSSVKRPATVYSLAEILKEFKAYQNGGITDAELEFTKNSMLNQEAISYEAPYQKAGYLGSILTYNLEKDFKAKQKQILLGITKEEVNAQIKKHFDANKLITIVVGDKYYIENQMDKAVKDERFKETLNKVKMKKISLD